MSPLHKFVSFFQSDSKSRKNLLSQQKFASELNINGEIEVLKNQCGKLVGYRVKVLNLILWEKRNSLRDC
ncbi:unnamed protein product [Pieris macdunnoughi]|uniref:Uncharacterized protein n=1 Tax=Pieris macdunnoughi TaxID=345717 RepID=A0A821UPW2_9NEOP|nr:unnamed protein product [Pieris macdunnoughi]